MRRAFVVGLWAVLLAAASSCATAASLLSEEAASSLLKRGGVTLLLRHGQTEPGLGDPPGFRLDDCSTQRNLSSAGREALRDMAARNVQRGIVFERVYTSVWCRCRDTAKLLANDARAVSDWPALNSQFAGNPVDAESNTQVVARIRAVPTSERWLMVTHQVNITALTGVVPSMGEGVLVTRAASGLRVLGLVRL
jgi:broad specificity phosphatase PhoE